jgi:hypothetical protein
MYQEDTDRKDQGQSCLDEGSTPPMPDEDDPAITDTMAPMAGEGDETYKSPSNRVILTPPVKHTRSGQSIPA